jgi:hypothetical protein
MGNPVLDEEAALGGVVIEVACEGVGVVGPRATAKATPAESAADSPSDAPAITHRVTPRDFTGILLSLGYLRPYRAAVNIRRR